MRVSHTRTSWDRETDGADIGDRGEIRSQAFGLRFDAVSMVGFGLLMAVLLLSLVSGCGNTEPNWPGNAVSPAPGPVVAEPASSADRTRAQPIKATDAVYFGPAAARSRLVIAAPTDGQGRAVVALGAPVTDDNAGMYRHAEVMASCLGSSFARPC